MRILLTGATGFVGRRLWKHWSERDHQLVAVGRSAGRIRDVFGHAAGAVEWDPAGGPFPSEALEGVDAVVHLAGENVAGRWSEAKKKAIYDSRIVSTRNLVQGIADSAHKPTHLLCASGIGYYGDREDEILHEQSGPGDDFLAKVCIDWEHEAMAAREEGVRVVNMRFGIILGRDGGALAEMLTPFRFGVGGPLGSGRQWWSWIHINDVLHLIDHVLARDWNGPVNVASPHPERQRDFARALGRALKRPAVLPAPAFMLRVALGGFATELLTSKRVVPKRVTDDGFEFQFENLADALQFELS